MPAVCAGDESRQTRFVAGCRRPATLRSRLGCVRILMPAPPVQRRLFNGLAQVIVQSGRDAGEIRLTARSAGLAPAEGTVTVRTAP
jgi:beta-galactosidase